MDDKAVYTEKPNGKRVNILVAIVSAIIGSSGGLYIVLGTPLAQQIARPDPFTGTQASALEYRVSNLETRVTKHLGQHPDQIGLFERRITVLEVKLQQIITNQERIIRNQEK